MVKIRSYLPSTLNSVDLNLSDELNHKINHCVLCAIARSLLCSTLSRVWRLNLFPWEFSMASSLGTRLCLDFVGLYSL